MSGRCEAGGLLRIPSPQRDGVLGKGTVESAGRAGGKLLWSVLSKDENRAGRGRTGLSSSRGCWGVLLVESWPSCTGPKEPASSSAFPFSGLGFS